MFLEIEGGGLAGSEEVRDVLHLDERHGGLLELDSWRSDGQVDEPIMGSMLVTYYTSRLLSWIVLAGARSMAPTSKTYLQSATPSLRPSRRSAEDRLAPKMPSIQDRASAAAAGVYFSRRSFRRSLSKEDTDAIVVV